MKLRFLFGTLLFNFLPCGWGGPNCQTSRGRCGLSRQPIAILCPRPIAGPGTHRWPRPPRTLQSCSSDLGKRSKRNENYNTFKKWWTTEILVIRTQRVKDLTIPGKSLNVPSTHHTWFPERCWTPPCSQSRRRSGTARTFWNSQNK